MPVFLPTTFYNINSVKNKVVFEIEMGCHQAVIRQSSDSNQAVIRQSSDRHPYVLNIEWHVQCTT